MTIKAVRSGITARYWTKDCYNEKLTNVADQILFTVSMPSKGGGVTQVQLQVTSESFEALAQSMVDANLGAAVRAFVAGTRGRTISTRWMYAAVQAFVSTGYFQLILEAIMDRDEEGAIRTVGRVLQNNEDATVGACGTILLDKVGN